jgi:hypothetical protein
MIEPKGATEGAAEPAFDPDGDGWMRAMRRGDLAAAWMLSDAALQARAGRTCWDWPRHLQYVWDGTPLGGRRVLIRCYHGLGDTVQFVRFVPEVVRLAREVTLWVQPPLLPLLQRGQGDHGRLLALHDGTPEVDYDVDVELMELPHVLRTTWASLPRRVPYLAAGADHRFTRPKARLAVGLAWRAGEWDAGRSLPAVLASELGRVPGVQIVWLQDPDGARRDPLSAGLPWCPTPATALASAIAALDLVITVDSLPAHLGGALGRPTWTLLPAVADWRWMEGREDSPWYPTMRLFRQPQPGDWAAVIQRVKDELAALARTGQATV